MLSKKHNDPFYWKNKLETLERLPGEAIVEKNAMWERLDSRLHKAQTGNKAIWYWIAAGLLPLIIIAFSMIHDAEDILAKQPAEKKENANTTVSVLPPASKESLAVFVSVPVVKKQPVNGPVPGKEKKILTDTIKTDENITVAAFSKEPETAPAIDNILTGDTALAIATTTTVKKKLPVIHINELETFPLQFAEPVNYAESIKLRKNKPNYQNVASQQNRIGFNIKLSSKN